MFARVRSLFGAQDMTEGNIRNNLLRFSIPLLIGNFAQQLYTAVDSIIVSRAVENGLAAIGATFPIINFLIIIFMAISTGAGVMVAQFYGARDMERLSRTIGNTLMLIGVTSVVMMALAIPLSEPFLRLIDTPEEILYMAKPYLQIIFIGVAGSAFYNIVSGILRGLGDSLTPLLFLLLAAFTNTVLDIWFVWGLGWGVPGAAWATITSQALSAILCLVRLYRLESIRRLTKKDLAPSRETLTEIMRLGLPAGLTQGVFSLAMIMVQRLTNSMGTLVIAANTAVIRVDGFAMMPNFTFGMAATTFIGQNIGARKMERVYGGVRSATRLALVVSTTLTILILIFGRQLLGVFSNNAAVIDVGYGMMAILAIGYIAFSQSQTYGGILRGAGDTMPALWISIITTVFLRVPLAYLAAYLSRSAEWPNGHPYSLSISLLASWLVGALLTWLWYKKGSWRSKSVVPQDEALAAASAAGTTSGAEPAPLAAADTVLDTTLETPTAPGD